MIQVFEPKNEMLIFCLNSSSSNTNGIRGTKLSSLEASGHALSALKNNLQYDDSDTFSLIIKQITLWEQKLRNLQSQKLEI